MAFTRVPNTSKLVQQLTNTPNTMEGMDPSKLKEWFDDLGVDIRTYLNSTLLSELEGTGAAANIGISSITGLTAATVQAALAEIYTALGNATTGSLPNGSVTEAKLANLAVTTAKLGGLAVTTAKIADAAVTAAKLAANAVETAKIADSAVTEAKIAAGAVTNGKLAAKAVGTENLADELLVPIGKGGTGATSAAAARSALGAQVEIQTATFTLTVAGWNNKSQTVALNGITAASKFVASPSTAEGWSAAANAMLYPPTVSTDGALTFTCESVPTGAIEVTVYWW